MTVDLDSLVQAYARECASAIAGPPLSEREWSKEFKALRAQRVAPTLADLVILDGLILNTGQEPPRVTRLSRANFEALQEDYAVRGFTLRDFMRVGLLNVKVS